MKAKHFKDEDFKFLQNETISIEYWIPDQSEVDDGELPDFFIKTKEDYPMFVIDPLSIFLEQCTDYEDSITVICWLEYYIDEIKKHRDTMFTTNSHENPTPRS
jgi:hypothetical protein